MDNPANEVSDDECVYVPPYPPGENFFTYSARGMFDDSDDSENVEGNEGHNEDDNEEDGEPNGGPPDNENEGHDEHDNEEDGEPNGGPPDPNAAAIAAIVNNDDSDDDNNNGKHDEEVEENEGQDEMPINNEDDDEADEEPNDGPPDPNVATSAASITAMVDSYNRMKGGIWIQMRETKEFIDTETHLGDALQIYNQLVADLRDLESGSVRWLEEASNGRLITEAELVDTNNLFSSLLQQCIEKAATLMTEVRQLTEAKHRAAERK
jgi:hypothetical protein